MKRMTFARILEFIKYENLFYGGTFNAYHILICENDLIEENCNKELENLITVRMKLAKLQIWLTCIIFLV